VFNSAFSSGEDYDTESTTDSDASDDDVDEEDEQDQYQEGSYYIPLRHFTTSASRIRTTRSRTSIDDAKREFLLDNFEQFQEFLSRCHDDSLDDDDDCSSCGDEAEDKTPFFL
jgi:hypothetical protein